MSTRETPSNLPEAEPGGVGRRCPVVGIGASAGGVEALQALFRAMPDPPPAMAFVVVTHLGADHESALPTILRECTTMPVHAAHDATTVLPGHAYVLPYDAIITIAGGRLVLRAQAPGCRASANRSMSS